MTLLNLSNQPYAKRAIPLFYNAGSHPDSQNAFSSGSAIIGRHWTDCKRIVSLCGQIILRYGVALLLFVCHYYHIPAIKPDIDGDKTMATRFETKTCSRCGGCGHYSYNQISGTTCFGCAGSGITLTSRGFAARKFFTESLKTPVEQVCEGGFIRVDGRWRKIVEIKPSSTYAISNGEKLCGVDIKCLKISLTVWNGSVVEYANNEQERLQKLEAALAYQETLSANSKTKAPKAA